MRGHSLTLRSWGRVSDTGLGADVSSVQAAGVSALTTVTAKASGDLSASQVQWLRAWQAVVAAEAAGGYKLGCRGQLQVPMQSQMLISDLHKQLGARASCHGSGPAAGTLAAVGSLGCQHSLLWLQALTMGALPRRLVLAVKLEACRCPAGGVPCR